MACTRNNRFRRPKLRGRKASNDQRSASRPSFRRRNLIRHYENPCPRHRTLSIQTGLPPPPPPIPLRGIPGPGVSSRVRSRGTSPLPFPSARNGTRPQAGVRGSDLSCASALESGDSPLRWRTHAKPFLFWSVESSPSYAPRHHNSRATLTHRTSHPTGPSRPSRSALPACTPRLIGKTWMRCFPGSSCDRRRTGMMRAPGRIVRVLDLQCSVLNGEWRIDYRFGCRTLCQGNVMVNPEYNILACTSRYNV